MNKYGSAGIQAFEDTVQAAKQRGLLVIADGKRNDVDSTAEAYAAAYLGEKAFDVDAMTVTPYLTAATVCSLSSTTAASTAKGFSLFSKPRSRLRATIRIKCCKKPGAAV